jgi:hypothetical protein
MLPKPRASLALNLRFFISNIGDGVLVGFVDSFTVLADAWTRLDGGFCF